MNTLNKNKQQLKYIWEKLYLLTDYALLVQKAILGNFKIITFLLIFFLKPSRYFNDSEMVKMKILGKLDFDSKWSTLETKTSIIQNSRKNLNK